MTELRRRAVEGPAVGDTLSARRTFGNEDVHAFAALSRDYNPVHFEPRFAATKGFDGPICHGLLVGSLLTEIGGQLGWLASGMDFRFRRPVYPGDTVTCRVTIDYLSDDGRARATARFTNQNGEGVLEADLRGRLPGPPERAALRTMLDEGDPTNGLRD